MANQQAFLKALDAILAGAVGDLRQCLQAQPNVVHETFVDEMFIAALGHQFYAGDTLLHVAAAGFRASMVRNLLDAGALFSARNRRGAEPLHYAADANRFAPDDQAETITALIEAGACPIITDKSGTAPIHRAVRTRGAAAVRALLDGDADPCQVNGSGSTPLFLAQHTTGKGGSGTPEAKAQQAQIIEMLLAAGAS